MEVRGAVGVGWEAVDDDGVVRGRARVWTRPDERTFLVVSDPATRAARMALLRAVPSSVQGELHTSIRAGARRLREALEAQDFVEARCEALVEIDVVGAGEWLRANAGPPLELRGVGDVGLDRLRALDEELRDDVPGCDGWRWGREEFRAETLSAGHDDRLYRIAVDGDELLGLVRVWVWVDRDVPRLGLVAVRPSHRGRGVARTLLGAVVDELVVRGEPLLVAESDPTNAPARRLLDALGAERTGTMVDLVRAAAA